ncbi:hypothetical protein EDS67_25355 [candidate division KSB1 bacterium]|nr:MAG: hypothetical protein EDS67_25355 [candidate division KSB1 bacterium]MBC6950654.1 hypothetical protein [candidate division KSB1 bacterium]MCE7944928.1 hypothetical protein [Chlorobi bacterium CHB1]
MPETEKLPCNGSFFVFIRFHFHKLKTNSQNGNARIWQNSASSVIIGDKAFLPKCAEVTGHRRKKLAG